MNKMGKNIADVPRRKRGDCEVTKQRYLMFALKYVETNNGSKAAIYAGFEPSNSYQAGNRLLKIPEVQTLIADRREELQRDTKITTEMVLKRCWELANVDANDIVQFRRYACRHCHGVNNEYQWIDENEYWIAYARAAEKETELPTDNGGYGYLRQNEPNEACAHCDGLGDGEVVIHDSTGLTGAARALYDGVEQTKQGLKVKIRDRDKYLDMVARMVGAYKDSLTINNVTDDGGDEW